MAITAAPQLPNLSIIYNGKDITLDILPMLESIEYSDTIEGESSTFEITLDNSDFYWSNDWYPAKGDTIVAKIGDLDCGTFTIDEVVLSGAPDIIQIRCLENIITKQQVRTKRSKAHESKTLRQIAQHVADINGLTLVGTVPEISFQRISQRRENDLKFLRRIGYQFGIIFSIRDKKLIFTKLDELDKQKAGFSIHRQEMLSYTCTDKTYNTFKAVRLLYHDVKSKQTISHSNSGTDDGGVITIRNKDGIPFPHIVSGNDLVLHNRVENKKQAEVSGDSMLYRCNTLQQSGSFVLEGNALAVAGVNMEATGLGMACSGIWSIQKSVHRVDRGNGWQTSVDVKRLALISTERATAAEDAKKGKEGDDSGLSDLIGTGNMGEGKSYVKDGKLQYPSIGGADITQEKAAVQQALRFVIDFPNEFGSADKTKVEAASKKINTALSGMIAKKHNRVAEIIRLRSQRIGIMWLTLPDATHGNDLATKLIEDIPEMSDKSALF